MVHTRGHLATERGTGIAPATSRYIGNGHGIHRGRTCGFFSNRTRRLRIGPLALDETLAPGEYRELTPEELNALRQAVSGEEA